MEYRGKTQSTTRFGRRLALGLLASTAAGCARPFYKPQSVNETKSERPLVVLVAIDGVRWQDVFLGSDPALLGEAPSLCREMLVPNLVEMERHGSVLGAPGTPGFYASGPDFVSLPGYMEILSGTSETGCFTNDCRKTTQATLLDDYAQTPKYRPAVAGAFASWPAVEFAASRSGSSGIVSAGRHGGFNLDVLCAFSRCSKLFNEGENARTVMDVEPGFRPDGVTGQLARSFLSEASPDFLFVSLGETDEWGHLGDYSRYLAALQSADTFVGHLRQELSRCGRETALLVTTDHGRSDTFVEHGAAYPESARAFLFAEGSLIRSAGRIDYRRSYLKDIAPTLREISRLETKVESEQGRVLSELIKGGLS